tara:strand:- start:4184 stop:5584 length:1401 start_codon:yes stop_codon:yes gene_type:complete
LIAGVNEFYDIENFAVDWRKKFYGKPLAVMLPRNTNEVSRLISLINRTTNISIVPQGGNTGLAGGGTPNEHGNQVVLSLRRLNEIRTIDFLNRTLIAEAGCSLLNLQKVASEHKLYFPLDFSSRDSASLGGLLATDAGGLSVLKYGTAKDFCLGLEVVLANGEVWHGLRSLRKDNSGYSLKDLFIGSEGTLGIITAASMRLFSPVEKRITYVAMTVNLSSAIELFGELCSVTQDNVLAFEFMEKNAINLVRRYFPERVPVNFDEHLNSVICIIELSAAFEKNSTSYSSISEAFANNQLCTYYTKCSETMRKTIWQLRESITFASAEDGPQVKNDISLPLSRIPDFVDYITQKLLKVHPHGDFINFGHIGDGNLHFNFAPFFRRMSCKGEIKRQDIVNFLKENEEVIRGMINDAVVLHDGSITAEHGIGKLRKSENHRLKSDVELRIMRTIKNSIDPKNILNPEVLL